MSLESPTLPRAGVRELLLWAFGRRRRVRVRGESMNPALRSGDHVLLDEGAYRRALPIPGDVVVAAHPFVRDLQLVKRVQAVDPSGCTLAGDTPGSSTDSRDFGRVSLREVRGRVSARLG